MSLLFHMLFRFVIAFLPRSKHLLILWLQSLSAVILEPKKRKPVTTSTFPLSMWHEVMGLDAMILVFLMLSFKPAFLVKRLFNSSLSVIRVISLAYLRLLIFLSAILIPACDSSSLAFHILSPCLFNLYAEYIIWNAGLDEAQAGIKISRRTINNLRYADDTTLMAESEEELKSLLMKVKGEWKSWLKAQHSEN